ncbi:MAG: hypothetical protein QM754_19385 [Tepidisphaeraceae bacterium]
MNRLGTGRESGFEDFIAAQITVGRQRRPDADGFVRQRHVPRRRIGLTVNSDRFHAHLPQRTNYTASNRAAVGDEDFGKHDSVGGWQWAVGREEKTSHSHLLFFLPTAHCPPPTPPIR